MDLRDFSMMAFRLSVAPTTQLPYRKMREMVLIEISPSEDSPATDTEIASVIQ
jgi:hypothetical protein